MMTNKQMKALDTITGVLQGREVSEVKLMRAMAVAFMMLSEAQDDYNDESLLDEAEYFDKAIKMAVAASETVQKWKAREGIYSEGLLIKAKVKPVYEKMVGKGNVLLVADPQI